MKVSVSKIQYYYIAAIVWLFAGLSALLDLTPITYVVQLILLSTAILLAIVRLLRRFNQINKNILFMALVMIVLSTIRNGRTTVEVLIFSLMLLLCAIAQDSNWMEPMLRLLFYTYIVYLSATILFYFTPDFYLNYIVDLFPNTTRRLISWYSQGYMAGLTNHYSTNAMFLSTGLFVIIPYAFSKKKIKYKIMAVLFIAGLLLTGKRGPLIFAAAAIFGFYYFSIPKEKGATRLVKTVGVIVLSLCVFVIIVSVLPAFSGAIVRFQETIADGDVTMGRFGLWALAINAFIENPIFGIGWGQYYNTVSIAYDSTNLYHVHNTYLQILCETGVIGFIFFIGWMVSSLARTIKLYQKMKEWTREKCLMGFSLSFQLYFLLYSITGNTLYEEEIYVPYFIACAISIYFSKHFYLQDIRDKSIAENNI